MISGICSKGHLCELALVDEPEQPEQMRKIDVGLAMMTAYIMRDRGICPLWSHWLTLVRLNSSSPAFGQSAHHS